VAYLLDTSVLARLANQADAQHAIAVQSVVGLHRGGEVLCVTPQVLIEFRSVATRPKESNGLGMASADAVKEAAVFEQVFPLMLDTAEVYAAWKRIVETLQFTGKQVHDARLIAMCQVRGINDLLTFNVGHFQRIAACGPTVKIVSPVESAVK
jgi:predicted nucleic acid-binding protein